MLTAVVTWVAIASSIMRFENPKMTETELFLNLHRAVILLDAQY